MRSRSHVPSHDPSRSVRKSAKFVTLALALALSACSDDDSETSDQTLGNPIVLEMFARARGPALIGGILDGVERMLVALEGGAADGVVVTPVGAWNRAEVSIDTTGDGTRESSFLATVTGDFDAGATMVLTDIVHPSTPSLVASVDLVATETTPGVMSFSQFDGTMFSDEPGPRNASQIDYTGGDLGLDRSTGMPSGMATCEVTGEGDPVVLMTEFLPDGEGGWRVRVTGPGIDFTFP